jgi:ketosteroid isomerase-like protein
MKSLIAALALVAGLAAAPPASAGAAADAARATYLRFAAAQNARDLDAVGALFVDGPRFLWVSDGMSFWGRAAVLERMSLFQEAAIWRVDPALDEAVAVELDDKAAYLHLPLTLTIGAADGPEAFRFLVSVLCVETQAGWRIAALFTTTAKAH